MKKLLLLAFIGVSLNSCIHPMVKYRKRALLDPMMTGASTMSDNILTNEASTGVERGNLGGSDGSLGSNCPTCG